jgi:hypothetical protein
VEQLELTRGELDVNEYARLMVSIERADGDLVLADLGLPRAALVRIERVWTARMTADPAFGARVRSTMTATRRASTRPPKNTPFTELANPSWPRSGDR